MKNESQYKGEKQVYKKNSNGFYNWFLYPVITFAQIIDYPAVANPKKMDQDCKIGIIYQQVIGAVNSWVNQGCNIRNKNRKKGSCKKPEYPFFS
jgi:hypothetical protein